MHGKIKKKSFAITVYNFGKKCFVLCSPSDFAVMLTPVDMLNVANILKNNAFFYDLITQQIILVQLTAIQQLSFTKKEYINHSF